MENKTYEGYCYGNWKTVDSEVEAAIKEDLDENSEDMRDPMVSSVQVRKENVPAGTYYLKERPVYRCWKIEQQRYERIGGRTIKRGIPAYCYVQRFDYVEATVE